MPWVGVSEATKVGEGGTFIAVDAKIDYIDREGIPLIHDRAGTLAGVRIDNFHRKTLNSFLLMPGYVFSLVLLFSKPNLMVLHTTQVLYHPVFIKILLTRWIKLHFMSSIGGLFRRNSNSVSCSWFSRYLST